MPYDAKKNPNNNRLPEQNTFGRISEIKVGDKVWKLFGDMRHSFTYGTVERTEGMGGRVYVRWQSGVAYQEDPLYLLKREDFPYHTAMKTAAQKLAVRDLLAKKPKNHKEDCKCVFCERGSKKEDKPEEEEKDDSKKKVDKISHNTACSCPVCYSKTKKTGKVMVCTKEGCFFVRED